MRTYSLADAISAMKVASLGRRPTVIVPNTKVVKNVLKCFENLGVIFGYTVKDREVVVNLKYTDELVPLFQHVDIVSSPGRRVHASNKVLYLNMRKNPLVYYVVSTNKGIVWMYNGLGNPSGHGGEVLVEIIFIQKHPNFEDLFEVYFIC